MPLTIPFFLKNMSFVIWHMITLFILKAADKEQLLCHLDFNELHLMIF